MWTKEYSANITHSDPHSQLNCFQLEAWSVSASFTAHPKPGVPSEHLALMGTRSQAARLKHTPVEQYESRTEHPVVLLPRKQVCFGTSLI